MLSSPARFRLTYFLLYAPLGIYVPYLPVYFDRAGMSATQVAVLFSLPLALKTVVSPLWGRAADLGGARGRLLRLTAWLALAGSIAWLVPWGFEVALAGMAVYGIGRSPMPAFVDSAAVELARRPGHDYARLRLWGSIGFIAASAAAAACIELYGIGVVPVALVALNLALAVGARIDEPASMVSGPTLQSECVTDEARLMTPAFVALLVATSMHSAASSGYHTFFGILVADLGLDTTVTGAAWVLAVSAEVAMLMLAGRIIDRFGTKLLLAAAMMVSALRWWLLAHATGAAALIAIQSLHAFTFGAFLAAAVCYIGDSVPASARTTGQAVFGALAFGLGPLLGTLAAGSAYEWWGGTGMFEAAAVLDAVAAAVVVAGVRSRHRRLRPG